jgi:hypothetical protein
MEWLRLPRCVSRFDKKCQKVKRVYKTRAKRSIVHRGFRSLVHVLFAEKISRNRYFVNKR